MNYFRRAFRKNKKTVFFFFYVLLDIDSNSYDYCLPAINQRNNNDNANKKKNKKLK